MDTARWGWGRFWGADVSAAGTRNNNVQGRTPGIVQLLYERNRDKRVMHNVQLLPITIVFSSSQQPTNTGRYVSTTTRSHNNHSDFHHRQYVHCCLVKGGCYCSGRGAQECIGVFYYIFTNRPPPRCQALISTLCHCQGLL